MKILVTTSSFGDFDQTPLDQLKGLGFEVILNPFGQKLTVEQCLKLYSKDVVGVVAGTENISADVLKNATALKVISRCGIGLDSVDLKAAKEKNIQVYKTSSIVADAVAELTLGLILDALRSISLTDRMVRQGQWKKSMGYLLAHKTIGIVGLGAVGKRFVDLCQGFGCKFLACDLDQDKDFSKKHHLKYVELDELLSQADVVSLHLPFTPETTNLINDQKLKLMKKDAFLINTSRGDIVDEKALYQALKSKAIAGAGLDVFSIEPYSGPFKELDNIVLTTHIGSYARETRITMEREAVSNLIKGLNLPV